MVITIKDHFVQPRESVIYMYTDDDLYERTFP